MQVNLVIKGSIEVIYESVEIYELVEIYEIIS